MMIDIFDFIKQADELTTRLKGYYKQAEPFLDRRVIENLLIWVKADLKISRICREIEEYIIVAVRQKHALFTPHFKNPYQIDKEDPKDSVVPIKEILNVVHSIGEVLRRVEMVHLNLDTQNGAHALIIEADNIFNTAYSALQILNQNAPKFEGIISRNVLSPLYFKLGQLMRGLKSIQNEYNLPMPTWQRCLEFLPESIPNSHKNLENLTSIIIYLPKFLDASSAQWQKASDSHVLDAEVLKQKQAALQSNFEAMMTGSQLSAIPSYMNFMRLMSEYLPDLIPTAGPFAKENYTRAVKILKSLKEDCLPELIISIEELEEAILCEPGTLLKPVFVKMCQYHATVVSWVRQLELVSDYITTTADTLNTVWARTARLVMTANSAKVKTKRIKPVPNLEILVDDAFIHTIHEARVKRHAQSYAQATFVQGDLDAAREFFAQSEHESTKYIVNMLASRLTSDEISGLMRHYRIIQSYYAQCYPAQDRLICDDPNQWMKERREKNDLGLIKTKVFDFIHQSQSQEELHCKVMDYNARKWDETLSMSFALAAFTPDEIEALKLLLRSSDDKSILEEPDNGSQTAFTLKQVKVMRSALKRAKNDSLAEKLVLGNRIDVFSARESARWKKNYDIAALSLNKKRDVLLSTRLRTPMGQQWSNTLGLEKLSELQLSRKIMEFMSGQYRPQLQKVLEPEVFCAIQFDFTKISTSLERNNQFILHEHHHDAVQFHQKLVLSLNHLRIGLERLENIPNWIDSNNPWAGDPQYLPGRIRWVVDVLTTLLYDFYQTYHYIQDANMTPYTRGLILQSIAIIEPLAAIPWLRSMVKSLVTFKQNDGLLPELDFKVIWQQQQTIVERAINGDLIAYQETEEANAGLDSNILRRHFKIEPTEGEPVSGLLFAAQKLYDIPLWLHKLHGENTTRLKPYSEKEAQEKAQALVEEINAWGINLETGKRIIRTVNTFHELIANIGKDTRELAIARLRTAGTELGYAMLKLGDDAEFKLGCQPGKFTEDLCEKFKQYHAFVLAQFPFENEQERLEILTDMGIINNRVADELGRYNVELEAVKVDCEKLQAVILDAQENLKKDVQGVYQKLQPYLCQIKGCYSVAPYLRTLRDKSDFTNAINNISNDMPLLDHLLKHKQNQLVSIKSRCDKRIEYMLKIQKSQQASAQEVIRRFKMSCLKENLTAQASQLEKIIPQDQWNPFEPTFEIRNKQLLNTVLSDVNMTHNIIDVIKQMVRKVFEKEYVRMMTAYQQLSKMENEILEKHPEALAERKNAKLVAIRWMKSTLLDTDLLPENRLRKVHQYATSDRVQAMMRQDTDGYISGVMNQLREIAFSVKPEATILHESFVSTLGLWAFDPPAVSSGAAAHRSAAPS